MLSGKRVGSRNIDNECHKRSHNYVTNFVKTIETHQHRKIACLEEIGYLNGWIGKDQLLTDIEPLKKNQYGQYLITSVPIIT